MAFVTAAQVQESLLAWLKGRGLAELPAGAADYVPRAVRYARLMLLKATLPLGYTAAQVEASDQAEEYTSIYGLYYCVVHAANLEASDLWAKNLLALADTLLDGGLTLGGEAVEPADDDAGGGAVGGGRLAAAAWCFSDGAGCCRDAATPESWPSPCAT